MSRMSRPVMFMESALLQARRSTCFRLNVGAVIVDPFVRSIIATGYNGPPADEPHCQGGVCQGVDGCSRAIHAEVNAMKKLRLRQISPMGLDMYSTHSPCPNCMRDIRTTRMFGRIFFQTEYRIADHLREYEKTFDIYKVTPAGYITRFGDNTLVDPGTLYASNKP